MVMWRGFSTGAWERRRVHGWKEVAEIGMGGGGLWIWEDGPARGEKYGCGRRC